MPDRRILVVDDDLAVSQVLAEMLFAAGYVAEHVETVEIAREKLNEGGFLGAVIDCVMRGHREIELALLARSRGVAVVLMSGEDRTIAAMREGAFCFLQKPFRMADLLGALEEALRESAATRQASVS